MDAGSARRAVESKVVEPKGPSTGLVLRSGIGAFPPLQLHFWVSLMLAEVEIGREPRPLTSLVQTLILTFCLSPLPAGPEGVVSHSAVAGLLSLSGPYRGVVCCTACTCARSIPPMHPAAMYFWPPLPSSPFCRHAGSALRFSTRRPSNRPPPSPHQILSQPALGTRTARPSLEDSTQLIEPRAN